MSLVTGRTDILHLALHTFGQLLAAFGPLAGPIEAVVAALVGIALIAIANWLAQDELSRRIQTTTPKTTSAPVSNSLENEISKFKSLKSS